MVVWVWDGSGSEAHLAPSPRVAIRV